MSNHPLIPPAGYHVDSQGKLRKNPTTTAKPETKYISVYNNPRLAQKYRNLGYMVNHVQPNDSNNW